MDPVNDASLERDIERVLAVDPSPAFVARVRTRIAEQPLPAARWLDWRLATTVASALAASAVALVMLRSDRRVEPVDAPLMSRAFSSSVAVPQLSPGLAREHRPSTVDRRTQNGALRTTNLERQFSEAVFDRSETMALQRLIADVRSARVDLSPLMKDAPLARQPVDDLVIPPIAIEPLATGGMEGERQ